ncbi:MAG: TrkH family potassium uptake protein, partial [Caldilineaceae bacterium]|nr:TrkH family potassium uptake protein [Caldilineaceae bacterium]
MYLRSVLHFQGILLLFCAAFMLTALPWSFYYGESDWQAILLSAGITALTGAVMMRSTRITHELRAREGFAIVTFAWVLFSFFGSLPFMLSGAIPNFTNAFFETMSGFTTTGSTVIQDLTRYPAGILMWRAFTQWLGGLGILVLFVALLSSLGVGSKALFQHESSAKHGGGVKARIQDVAARLWQIYLGLSILCWAGLMLLGMNAYEAATHTMTALSTGGFSTRNESVGAFQSVGIELWLTLFMLLGGISFMLYAWLLRGRWDRWRSEEEAKVFLGILLVATVVIAGDLVWVGRKHAFLPALRESLFQVVSITTTTGFGSADFDQW